MSLVVSFEEIFENKSGLLSNHQTWNRVELAAVAKILNGYAFKSDFFSKENGFPLIRIRDIAKNKTETYFEGPYPQEYMVRSGDLLIGMDGNFSCNEWKGKNGLLNQRVCKIIPDERYLKKNPFYLP
jgi:type I restriction enzyme S subunit